MWGNKLCPKFPKSRPYNTKINSINVFSSHLTSYNSCYSQISTVQYNFHEFCEQIIKKLIHFLWLTRFPSFLLCHSFNDASSSFHIMFLIEQAFILVYLVFTLHTRRGGCLLKLLCSVCFYGCSLVKFDSPFSSFVFCL